MAGDGVSMSSRKTSSNMALDLETPTGITVVPSSLPLLDGRVSTTRPISIICDELDDDDDVIKLLSLPSDAFSSS